MENKLRQMWIDADCRRFFLEEQKIFHEQNSLFSEKMLNEAYGSFPGQYDSVKKLTDKIFSDFNGGQNTQNNDVTVVETVGDIEGIGKVKVISKWTLDINFKGKTVQGVREYDDNTPTIKLKIIWGGTPKYKLITTVCHEIMHCFQDNLPKIKGVNEKSMILYRYLSDFVNGSNSEFTRYFFYGLYCSYSIEVSANVSTIGSFMGEYFKDKKKNNIKTLDYQEALAQCDTYQIYVKILNKLTTLQPTKEDKEYITQCMTRPMLNFYYFNMPIQLYKPETFDVDRFIEQNKQKIIQVSETTLGKMRKNIMNYIEKQ